MCIRPSISFQDLVKIYTVYNDALINLLEKFFEMKKSDCKEMIGVYRRFLLRQESIQRFLQLAEVPMVWRGGWECW
jgi:hypothetical protein